MRAHGRGLRVRGEEGGGPYHTHRGLGGGWRRRPVGPPSPEQEQKTSRKARTRAARARGRVRRKGYIAQDRMESIRWMLGDAATPFNGVDGMEQFNGVDGIERFHGVD